MMLLTWGMAAFEGKLKPEAAAQWREMLTKARTAKIEPEERAVTNGGFGYVAAVAVRDHWDEMDQTQRDWCVGHIGSEIRKDFATENEELAVQNNPMNGDRPAAYSAAKLFAKMPNEEDVRELLSCALTHAVEQVRIYAAAGLEHEFSKSNPTLFGHVLRCFAAGSNHYQSLLDADEKKDWAKQDKLMDLLHEALDHTQKLIQENSPLSDDSVAKLRIDANGADLFVTAVANWLALLPESAAATEFFACNTDLLTAIWTDHKDRHQKHTSVVDAFERSLARYLLRTKPADAEALAKKIAAVTSKAPDEVGMFVWGLIIESDRLGTVEQFWRLWPVFRDQTVALPVHQLQRQQLRLVRQLFLDLEGSTDGEDFPLIRGREGQIIDYYRALPASEFATVLCLRYLKRFGQAALPGAFVEIAKKIQDDPSEEHLSENTVFLLEQILSARIFATPLELKKNPEVRNAVLLILDALVNIGSAAAFIMRDDFATPIPTSAH
jgi:hypothetical protein